MSPILPPRLLWILAAILAGCLGLILVVPWDGKEVGGYATYGGLLQGVAGSLALVLVWRTLQLQREELQLQRQELQLTREEMKASTAEQRRLADQHAEQLAALREQSGLLREQVARQVRPALHAWVQRGTQGTIYIRNDGVARAIISRVHCSHGERVAHDVQGVLDPLLLSERIPNARQAYWQDVCPESVLEEHKLKPLCGIDLTQVDRESSDRLLTKLAAVKVVVEYRNVYDEVQQPLEFDLGIVRNARV